MAIEDQHRRLPIASQAKEVRRQAVLDIVDTAQKVTRDITHTFFLETDPFELGKETSKFFQLYLLGEAGDYVANNLSSPLWNFDPHIYRDNSASDITSLHQQAIEQIQQKQDALEKQYDLTEGQKVFMDKNHEPLKSLARQMAHDFLMIPPRDSSEAEYMMERYYDSLDAYRDSKYDNLAKENFLKRAKIPPCIRAKRFILDHQTILAPAAAAIATVSVLTGMQAFSGEKYPEQSQAAPQANLSLMKESSNQPRTQTDKDYLNQYIQRLKDQKKPYGKTIISNAFRNKILFKVGEAKAAIAYDFPDTDAGKPTGHIFHSQDTFEATDFAVTQDKKGIIEIWASLGFLLTQGEVKQVWIPLEQPYLTTAAPADPGVDLREEIDASSTRAR